MVDIPSFTISVTEHDILTGVRSDCLLCPVAMAVCRALRKAGLVIKDEDQVRVFSRGNAELMFYAEGRIGSFAARLVKRVWEPEDREAVESFIDTFDRWGNSLEKLQPQSFNYKLNPAYSEQF